MFYFNKCERFKYYEHNYKCYGHNYDARSEIEILENYIKKFKQYKNLHYEVCKLGREISHSLHKQIYNDTNLEIFKI